MGLDLGAVLHVHCDTTVVVQQNKLTCTTRFIHIRLRPADNSRDVSYVYQFWGSRKLPGRGYYAPSALGEERVGVYDCGPSLGGLHYP